MWRILVLHNPDFVMLQESMVSGAKAINFLLVILPTWNFCASDSNGLLGGLVSA